MTTNRPFIQLSYIHSYNSEWTISNTIQIYMYLSFNFHASIHTTLKDKNKNKFSFT